MEFRRWKPSICRHLGEISVKQACLILTLTIAIVIIYTALTVDRRTEKRQLSNGIKSHKYIKEDVVETEDNLIMLKQAHMDKAKRKQAMVDLPSYIDEDEVLAAKQFQDKVSIQWWLNYFPESKTKGKKVRLVLIVSSAPKRYHERQAIRETWWKKCKELSDVLCVFFTDGIIEDDETRKDLRTENQHSEFDMNIHPFKSEFNFGERYIYHLKWAIKNYNFDYMLRIDDDQFLCLDHLLSHLTNSRNNFIWSNIYCQKNVIRPDSRFIMLSYDLVEKFTQVVSQLKCHPYIDQQVALWVQQLNLKDLYFHERRLYHQGPIGAILSNPILLDGVCSQYISIHGVSSYQTKQLWKERGNVTRFPEELPFRFEEHCEFEQNFQWFAMAETLRYEPQNCSGKLRWRANGAIQGDDVVIAKPPHQEIPIQKPSKIEWKDLLPIIKTQLHEWYPKPKWWPFNLTTEITKTREEYQLVLIVSSAPQRYNRRHAIRETWWKDCQENKQVKCLFMTDGDISDEILQKTLIEEHSQYSDIVFQPLPVGDGKFGQRLLYQMRYVSSTYKYMFFMKVDDDQFVCLKRLMSDIRDAPREHLIWSFIHCEDSLVRPDEGFIIISKDIVRVFLAQDENLMKCHPYADQQIGVWVKELGLKHVYYHDRRIHHDPPASKMKHIFLKHDICSLYISLHGTYAKDMYTFWNVKKVTRNFHTIHILPYDEYCYYKQEMDWQKFSLLWRYEPKVCKDKPTWNITNDSGYHEGREAIL